MSSDEVVLGPEAWPEIQKILEEKSKLRPNEQAFLLWLGVEIIEELLQYPADVKKMQREAHVGPEVAKGLLEKMRVKLAELEKVCLR